ncbi:MAG: transcriptional regulator [Candidatus Bathyarchaeia archaeon]
MKPPCEVVVRYVLPTVRALIAKELIERYGLNQAEAAGKLGTTQAAVSQYLSAKRGSSSTPIERLPPVRGAVDQIARGLVEENLPEEQLMKEVCDLCELLRAESKSVMCELHSEISPALSGSCRLCAQKT